MGAGSQPLGPYGGTGLVGAECIARGKPRGEARKKGGEDNCCSIQIQYLKISDRAR